MNQLLIYIFVCKLSVNFVLPSLGQLFELLKNSHTVDTVTLGKMTNRDKSQACCRTVDSVSTINWLDNFCAGFY